MPRATTPRVYAVRAAVAKAINALIQSGAVPLLTEEEIIAGVVAEAILRVDMLDRERRLP